MKIKTILEEIARQDLLNLEKELDRIYKAVGIDVEFSRHFAERANSSRNGKPITIHELKDLYLKVYGRYGAAFRKAVVERKDDLEAVLNDINSKLNVPFVLSLDKNGDVDFTAKTIMRKDKFLTSNKVFRV